MRDFHEIFERHFFSNHHLEAIEVERELESRFDGCQCVTFSSLPALVVAVLDTMIEPGSSPAELVQTDAADPTLTALNRFLETSGRPVLRTLDGDGCERVRSASTLPFTCAGQPAQALLLEAGAPTAALFDLGSLDAMLASVGLFVTRDDAKAEKVRWSRSSYGRRAATRIPISANGRFSEFQGLLVNAALAGTEA